MGLGPRVVADDGQVVKCFAVTDITIDQAGMIVAARIGLIFGIYAAG
jgi:hypothetical protein